MLKKIGHSLRHEPRGTLSRLVLPGTSSFAMYVDISSYTAKIGRSYSFYYENILEYIF